MTLLTGPAILRSKEEVRAGEWLKVTAERTYREGVLMLNDGAPVHGKSPGSTRGLNLNSRFYVGGWDRQKVELNPLVNVSSSFHGCLSQVWFTSISNIWSYLKQLILIIF